MTVYDTYTKLMLHMNGADASTTFTDEIGKTVTVYGNAQIDTVQSKFGGASGLFDGSGDYLSVAASADFTFGTGDFTIDFWIRPVLDANFRRWVTTTVGGVDDNSVLIRQSSDNLLAGYIGTNGFSYSGLTANAWNHIAVCVASKIAYFFINGVLKGTIDASANWNTTTNTLFIGGYYGAGEYLNGWMDELRVSKGIARWTANFTPPTVEYGASRSFGMIIG